MLLEQHDSILDSVNNVYSHCRAADSELNSYIFDKARELSKLIAQLIEVEKEERFQQVIGEGITFKEESKNSSIKIGRDQFWNVAKLQAKVISNKFCEVKILTSNENYEYTAKVKTEALKQALDLYRHKIVS